MKKIIYLFLFSLKNYSNNINDNNENNEKIIILNDQEMILNKNQNLSYEMKRINYEQHRINQYRKFINGIIFLELQFIFINILIMIFNYINNKKITINLNNMYKFQIYNLLYKILMIYLLFSLTRIIKFLITIPNLEENLKNQSVELFYLYKTINNYIFFAKFFFIMSLLYYLNSFFIHIPIKFSINNSYISIIINITIKLLYILILLIYFYKLFKMLYHFFKNISQYSVLKKIMMDTIIDNQKKNTYS